MSVIDRAISYFSPRWSAERIAWRKIENSYKGGVPTRTSESWARSQGYKFNDPGTRLQVANARDRAYQAYRDNSIARTLVQTETDNVIGDGLNYQPSSSSEEWNKEAKDRYYDWLETASVRGEDIQTGCELQRLIWDRSRVAGDIGWLLVNQDGFSPGSESRLQVIQSENIATPDGQYGDASIYDGIRYDPLQRPLQFFLLSQDGRGQRSFTTIAARDFVYLPHMPEPNMSRGETCFMTIFDQLAEFDRYREGVSLAAWMATVFGIVFKQNNAGRQLSQLPTVTNSQGDQQKSLVFENGMFKYIGTDEDVAQVQAHQPMQQTPDFIVTLLRLIGQPFDMPLEILAKDVSRVNFASARIGLLPFYRSCRIKAVKFAGRWGRTIRWWLSRERLRLEGDPRKWRTAFPEDYFNHELLVNAWDYTDPVSEAQADQLQIDMGTKSPQMVISERGRDAQKILTEREQWAKETADLPEVRSTLTRDPAPDPAEQPPPLPAQQDQQQNDSVRAYVRAFRDILAERNGDE